MTLFGDSAEKSASEFGSSIMNMKGKFEKISFKKSSKHESFEKVLTPT
jgi:hypothetical protein